MNRQTIGRTTVTAAMLLVGCVSVQAQEPSLKPRVIQTKYSTDDIVVAVAVATEAPFNARGDGTNDCTAAIQAAIDAVAKAGGGVVFLPEGRYLCKGNLLLRETVTLRGDWRSPEKDPKVVGTILMPTAGRGKADGLPFMVLERGSCVRHLSIWYPEQHPEAIVPYPWTLASAGLQSSCIFYVNLVNSYQGVKYGPKENDCHMFWEVYGTPLKCGFDIDRCFDVGRIVRVRLGPQYWLGSGLMEKTEKSEAALRAFLYTEGTGIIIRFSDAENVYDVRIAGYAKGLHLTSEGWAIFHGVEAVGGQIGVQIDDGWRHPKLFTNCRFDGTVAGVVDRVGGPFNACILGGEARTAVKFDGKQTLSLQNCTIAGWTETGVTAAQGTANIMGCDFKKEGSHIRLGPGVKRSLILGNKFAGKPGIDKQSQGDVQISHHDFRFPTPGKPAELPPEPRPSTAELFNVLDYGARGDAKTDNTQAFQKALDAAGKAGGGTVYVPGGNFLFFGSLTVPSGVEVRGCFEAAHHTISGGSTLMPTAGHGEENGTPFLRLAARSGVRGLTFWYPEQSPDDVKPYPWTVQSTGPGCWILYVSCGNAYQAADFGTHPSEGHLIRCLWGAPLRKGLWVSKGGGTVDNCHFNPGLWARRHPSYPAPAGTPAAPWKQVIEYENKYLDAFIFGRCPKTLQVNNFVYGMRSGLLFVDDEGGSAGKVINFQVDMSEMSSTMLQIEAGNPAGLEFINFSGTGNGPKGQLVTKGKFGPIRMFNTHLNGSMTNDGVGDLLVQQGFAETATINAGRVDLQNVFLCARSPYYKLSTPPVPLQIGGNVGRLSLIGNTNERGDLFRFDSAKNVTGFANSIEPRVDKFETSFEKGQPVPGDNIQPAILSNVNGVSCRVVPDAGREGKAGLVINGERKGAKSTCVYFAIFDARIVIKPSTVIRYWIKPENELGRSTGIDLFFEDGSDLRDSQARDQQGQSLHPGAARGAVGQWTQIESPIGRWLTGKFTRQVVLACDGDRTNGLFKAAVDDIFIGDAEGALLESQAKPEGGSYPAPLKVELVASPKNGRIRYTLDGSMPVGTSPVYEKPIVFDKPGAYEVRFQTLDGSSNAVTTVSSRLYDVR